MLVGRKVWLRAGLAAAWIVASPIAAQQNAVPTAAAGAHEPAAEETLGYVPDVTARMTVAVNISGRGPYRFIVDTGAERTAISRELARNLALGPGRPAVVHSLTESSRITTVLIPGLQIGSRRVADIHAPAFAQRNLGAEGLLGVDSLQRTRVEFDFARQQMTIVPSRERAPHWEGDTIVITARNRLGRLVLVDARVEGERVWVVIDTGAQVTLGNNALRRRLERRGRIGAVVPVELISVTGGNFTADATVARRIEIGGVEIRDLPIAFSDAHPFRQLGLSDRPAILLGMEPLQLFDRVSVDFASRRVRMQIPTSTGLSPMRMADAAPPLRSGAAH